MNGTAHGTLDRRILRATLAGIVALALGVAALVAIRPAAAGTAPRRIVNGWLPYWSMPASLAVVTGNADLWGEASPFWYQATGATTITGHAGAGDTAVVGALRSRGVKVVPSVTETLAAPAMAALLADPARRAAHVGALTRLVTANGYDGVDLDYETMNTGGTAAERAGVRTGFVALARELGAALDARGKLLSITVGPRTRADDPNWAVFDYAALGRAADRFRIMTYDRHWRNGTPGAVAPLPWVTTVLAYATSVVAPAKIDVGVPLYGYDWPVDAAQPDGYGTATSLTHQQAEALRAQYRAARQYSATDAAPWFGYTAADGVRHVVWYNDVDATRAKTSLVGRFGLHGLAFWAVGSDDVRQWAPLRSYAVQRVTTLSVTAPATVTHGTAATVTGRLVTAAGTAVAGQRTSLQWRASATAAWRTVATGTTAATGTVTLRHTPTGNGFYRLSASASWTHLAAASAPAATRVRWRVTAAGPGPVRRGATVRLTGKVLPARAGTVVQRQRHLGAGRWGLVSSAKVRADGTYVFAFVASARGTSTYRVVAPGTRLNVTGASGPVQVVVS